MNYDILNELVQKEKSTRDIAKELNTSQTNIRYWLKKYNLKTDCKWKINRTETHRVCWNCKENKLLSEFYSRHRKYGDVHSSCKLCSNKKRSNDYKLFKKKCIDYKDGKCISCGYDKYFGALEFHHIDPTQKEFGLSNVRGTTFCDNTKKELDKCNLLCSNCHREEHARMSGILKESEASET